ncbi:hypothetical protein LEM8419_01913 [Neolewinella maritima]|uniref:VanZ-like domain-containing protein n=1 Tax=Neolewinella maritima TaxID=1383882 RepID=A0ABN8F947_9BACT|nr:VanZ family protein [Neolewinella maritima]CAH1000844.1 hypothetical protein LEM8419_01913 [Neolewinella maritima]
MSHATPPFVSIREKRLWGWTTAVVIAIFATLFIGRPLASQLREQNVQAIFFGSGLLLVTAAVLAHGLTAKPGRVELSILLGIIAVYVMLIFRLGAPERSHLIEYSVLAIFLHKALLERSSQRKLPLQPALLASVLACFVGLLDEGLQLVVPNRVFDPQDIIFNGLAVLLAITASLVLGWARRRYGRSSTK